MNIVTKIVTYPLLVLKRVSYLLTIKHKERTIFLLIIAIHWIYGFAYITGSQFYEQYIKSVDASTGVSQEIFKFNKKNKSSEQQIIQYGVGDQENQNSTPEQRYIKAYQEDKGFRQYIDNMNVPLNNPGNLRFMGQPGATNNGGFAHFKDNYTGFRALIMQITLDMNRGDTLEKFITEYAPPKENDTENYIQICEKQVGSRKQSLKDIDILNLATAMVFAEHSIRY